MNEMNDSSSRIKALIGKFDYLDQEAMIEMLHTMGDGNDFEDGEEIANTPSAFLEDAKNSVFQYVNEIKELSDSQASLLENLKSWFKNLSNNETFLQNETQGNSESFDKTNVFEFISEYIQETEERMEIAQNIHSDVTHFWMEQMGKYKKSVIQKEIEIKQLKKSLEIAAGKSKKGNKKDKSEKNDKNDNNDKNETDLQKNLKTQLRKVEEQKNTIDKLKNQLHDVQGQLAFIQARSTPSSENFQLRIAERDNELSQSKYENETKVEMLQQRIAQLEKQIQRLQGDLVEEREKFQMSMNQLNTAKSRNKELENSIQKYIKLLELEKNNQKPAEVPVDTSKDELLEQRMMEIARCKEEMRELKMKHREELFSQAETLRSKFASEKNKLISSMGAKDNQALLQSIVDEYEKKLDEQRQAYDDLGTNLVRQWGGKVSLLTKQYESRIKNLQASNEVAILKKKEEIQFEVQKEKLEMEEELNRKVLEISQMFTNKIAKMERMQTRLQARNDAMIEEINNYKDLLNLKKIEEEVETSRTQKSEGSEIEGNNPIESYVHRLKVIKSELDEQRQWELEKQKDYYEQQIQKTTSSHQIEMRNLLLKIQDSLSKVNSEGENTITVSDALSKVSDAFITLNLQCGINEEEERSEEMISIKEATDRMTLLKEKIIHLQNENNELRKGDFSSDFTNYEYENEQLKMRLKFLESLKNGDGDEAQKNFQKIEDELRMELDVKDAIIAQLKAHLGPCLLETIDIFSKAPSKNEAKPITIINTQQPLEKTSYQTTVNTKNTNDRIISPLNTVRKKLELEINFVPLYLEIPLEYFIEEEEDFPETEQSKTTENNQRNGMNVINSKNDDNIENINEDLPNITKEKIEFPKNPLLLEEKPLDMPPIPQNPLLVEEKQKAQKPIIKTKIKTIIKEVPVIEYREPLRIKVKKDISSSVSIELFEKQYNFILIKGQSLTLQTNPPAKHGKISEATQVIHEKASETQPLKSIPEKEENPIKIVDSTPPPPIINQAQFLLPNPFTDQNEEYDKINSYDKSNSNTNSNSNINSPTRKVGLPPQFQPKTRILNKHVEPLIPPPPPKEFSNVETSTDKELLIPLIPPPQIIEKFLEIPKAQLIMSDAMFHANIPMRYSAISTNAVKVVKLSGSKVISEYRIADFEPKPPQTIVITADEDTKAKIDALQEQIKNMSKNTTDQQVRSDMLKGIPERTVSFRDRTISYKDNIIESLKARIDVLEEQKRRERAQKLADIKKKSQELYSIPRNLTGPLLVEPNPKTKESIDKPQNKLTGMQLTKEKTTVSFHSSPLPTLNPEDSTIKIDPTKELINSIDPIGDSINIINGNIKLLSANIESGTRITSISKDDIDAFESFLRATKNYDENSQKFISQIKDNEKLFIDNIFQLNSLQVRQNQALLLLKNIKKEDLIRKKELTLEEKLKIQQKILDDIQHKSEKTVDSVDQLLVLQQIQSAIEVVEGFEVIESNEEDSKILRALKFKVIDFQAKLKNGKTVDQIILDTLVMQTQNFLAGIRPKTETKKENEDQTLQRQNEKLRHQARKYRKAQKTAEKELSLLKDKEASLEAKIGVLQGRLCEQKELAENSSTMYFAQMASIKEIMNQFNSGDPNNKDFVNQIKNEVMNLQVMAETAAHEKEIYKTKANEAEDRILQADSEKASAVRQLNELQAKFEIVDSKLKKAVEDKLFFDSDIQKLKTEKAIEIEAKMILNEQIQKLIEENAKIGRKLNKKVEKLRKAKNEINGLKMENEELTIKLTFGHFHRHIVPKIGIGTQTMFHRRSKPQDTKTDNNHNSNNNPSILQPQENEINKNNESNNINDIQSNTSNNLNTPQNDEYNLNNNDQININEEEEGNENIKLTEMKMNSSADYSLSNSQGLPISSTNSSLFASQVQWEEEIDPDQYNVELADAMPTSRPDNILSIGEKAVESVHQPLIYKKKQPPVQTSYQTPKSLKQRPKTIAKATRMQINPEDLTVGNVQPGKRQLTGATQAPKPLLPGRMQQHPSSALNNLNSPILEPLESALTTVNFSNSANINSSINSNASSNTNSHANFNFNGRHSATEPTSPRGYGKKIFPSTPMAHATRAEKNVISLADTVKITRFEVDTPPQSPPKTPIITPKIQAKRPSNTGSGGNSSNMPNMVEVHRVLLRLREKSAKLQKKLEKKMKFIDELKKKLADATRENQNQRLSILRAEEEAKRSNLRFESLNVRYEIISKELSSKEEELTECKRDLADLRKISAPAASSFSRLKNAQIEQLRIQNEKERHKDVITVAKSALSHSTSEEAQQHLGKLMLNTQRSIARLEAKRQMWKEFEKKQIMATLGALSLIDDKQALLTIRKNFSPFRNTRKRRNIRSHFDMIDNFDTTLAVPEPQKIENVPPTFSKQLENIDRMVPELSENEKKQIIHGTIQPELAARIKETEKRREESESIENVIVTPSKK